MPWGRQTVTHILSKLTARRIDTPKPKRESKNLPSDYVVHFY